MSFYKYLVEKRKDSLELKVAMESTAKNLLKYHTNELKPGMLLGLIQSGKTRAFTGVMAKCFDLGFDIVVIFSKNSVALVQQTLMRLRTEFETPLSANKLFIWDIVKLQKGTLSGYILNNKQIFVVKKESKNLDRLISLFKDEKKLQNKKILIIDDEADQAGVSFVDDKTKSEEIEFAQISKKLSEFRSMSKGKNSYLQVTATPYSLYLQPENLSVNNVAYAPLRPAFTQLLNAHPLYIGGKYYFEDSKNDESPASFLHVLVSDPELSFLNSKSKTTSTYDSRIIKNLLATDKIDSIRLSLLMFLVGGVIRQHQEKSDTLWAKPYHCAFIVHTAVAKKIHAMQKHLVEEIINSLKLETESQLKEILSFAYVSLKHSIIKSKLKLPTLEFVAKNVLIALKNNFVGIIEVNSQNQVAELLGNDGQLRLDNPFNIFVGGQSLDRGITIDHLIGFFYGRNPAKFQMDTVLQHSRMYGVRSKEDLAVTRFYTSARIYDAMRKMHWFDKDLREDFETFGTKAMVRFIAKLGNEIIPAGPSKLKASNLMSFKAFSILLPIGFQTRSNTDIKRNIGKIDKVLSEFNPNNKSHFEIPLFDAIQIIKLIEDTFSYEPRYNNVGLNWDTQPFIRAIEIAADKYKTKKLAIYTREDRQISRWKKGGTTFSDAPADGKVDIPILRKLAANGPVLALLKQKGKEVDGWKDAPFYWPISMMPEKMPNYVYCEE